MLRSKIHIRRKGAIFSVLIAIFLLGIGAVVAFNSDQFNFANLFHLAADTVEYKEDFVSPSNWSPCTETPKTVIATNKSAVPIKVRLSYDEFWRNKTDTENLPLEDNGTTMAIINFQNEADWTRHGDWYYYKEDLQPGESTTSMFKSVTLNCDANFGSINTCTETETGTVCTEVENPYENAKYHLAVTVQTSTEDFPREDEFYTVTIDPNGGTYNGSSEIYSESIKYGTTLDLSSIAYADHELQNWTLNGNQTYTDSTIRITDHTALKANWLWGIYHTVAVNPNGGTLAGSTESSSRQVRHEDQYTLTSEEPTREGYLFDGWMLNGNIITDRNFTILGDIEFIAQWSPVIAKNNNTNKLYRSITEAESEAQSGDTITLLRNTEEQFTNTKNITLNLGNHVLSGSITNNGALTLLNGEVNNSDGIAVTNNGALTIGINDYKDDGTVNIESDSIRLIGTTTGLKQNGTFNYYDGFIEGDIALEGGYNDSPFYRKVFDDEEVHYFPFVDKSPDDDTKQRVILESSDLAVSKTKVGGDIYYYNLQDNINTSARTGYKIFAVRDFDANYSITVADNTDIIIDICGYNITINDVISINGKLTIEDSETTTETIDVDDNSTAMPSINGNVFITPHADNTTTTTTYAGKISVPQTIINNGNFVIKNALIISTTTNNTIQNYATLTMQNGALGSALKNALHTIENASYNLDKNSYIFSLASSSYAAVVNNIADFTWSSGNIYGNYYGLANNSNTKTTLTSGVIYGTNTGLYNNSGAQAIIDGGSIRSTSTGVNQKVTMNSGDITVIGTTKESVGISAEPNTVLINGGTILVKTTSGRARGVYLQWWNSHAQITMNGGTIVASSTSGTAEGLHSYWGNHITINDGVISANSERGTSYGINLQDSSGNGSLTRNIIGGKIIGGTYGIYIQEGNNRPTTIGLDDGTISRTSPEIIGGSYALYDGNGKTMVQFYDGILRGGVKAYPDGIIAGTPDATTVHNEPSADYAENRWLIPVENWLAVGENEFNSLGNAYAAITGDSGTVKVIKDITVESAHSESPTDKNITFDLNGHQLTLALPVKNNGTMTIVDSSAEKTGILRNSGAQNAAIQNFGTLTIESGHLTSVYRTISNKANSTLNINGGLIESNETCVYSEGNPVAINMNGGTVGGNNASYGFYGNSYTTLTMSGGEINITQVTKEATGIYGGTAVINEGASIILGSTGAANGVQSAALTMNGGNITVTTSYNTSGNSIHARGVRAGSLTMNSGNITVSSTGAGANTYGAENVNPYTINGGIITVSSTGSSAYGFYSGTEGSNGWSRNINGGTITVIGKNTTYGIYSFSRPVKMSGGTLNVTSSNGTAYGAYMSEPFTITGGKIESSTYGIYMYDSSILTIGTNDDEVSIEDPEIIGGQYALYCGNGNGYAVFYDGILRGGVKAYPDGIMKKLASGQTILIENQTIDNIDYEIRHLTPEEPVAMIGDTEYMRLIDAVAVAEENDTIDLIRDNYVFDALTIPQEKKITIQTNGFNIIPSNPIINNGILEITTSPNKQIPEISYSNSSYIILNSSAAKLTLNRIKISSAYCIENQGDLTITESNMVSTNTAIKNTGTLNATSTSLNATSYPFYNDGGEAAFTNSTINNGALYNNAGSLSLNNSNASKLGSSSATFFTNNGSAVLDNSTLNHTITSTSGLTYHDVTRTISNSGTLSIENNTTITHAINISSTSYYDMTAIYNTGDIHMSSSTLIADNTLSPYGYQTTGIKNDSGTLTLETGTIIAKTKTGDATYGIHNTTGTVTIGVPEPESSPHYGRDTADVSTTNPSITAIDIRTTNKKPGIGIKNGSGRIYYYDGRITGSSATMPEEPAGVEYLYEPKDYIDEETGYHYRILEWMRKQPTN